jgi:L-rhamnonate dehydratase
MSNAFRIKNVRVWTVSKSSKGGDYFNQGGGEHWLVDSLISNPMSGYAPYQAKRTSWGVGVLGSIVVEIEAEDGTVGVATGTGGVPAAWLIANHFSRFLVGQDTRNTNLIWDQMYRASLPYGRKGITVMAISAVDLALAGQNQRRAGLQSDRRAHARRDFVLLYWPQCRRDQRNGVLGS